MILLPSFLFFWMPGLKWCECVHLTTLFIDLSCELEMWLNVELGTTNEDFKNSFIKY